MRGITLDWVLDGLIEDGLVEPERAQTLKAVHSGRRSEQHPLVMVAQHHWVNARQPDQLLDLETLTRWMAERFGLPYYRFDPLNIDVASIVSVMSYAYARRFNILAVKVEIDAVTIATADPSVREWEQELARILGKRIERVVSDPDAIGRFLVEFYSLSRSVRGASDDRSTAQVSGVQSLEQLMELGRAGKLDADDQHVVNIVDWLLQYAYEQRASDIHLEPRREQGNIRFRIDGVMHLVYQVPPTVMAAVTSRIKILGRMDVSEKRRPQDGRVKTRSPQGKEVELRLSTMPTAFGEKLVMRIFDPDVLVKDFHALGFSDEVLNHWQRLIHEPHGIILVTGPTGSGKTTTLYTSLKELATPDVNVCTVEDPIELIEPNFNQMQVQHNIGLDFASGVRTLLRQDPDVIMVGEIRDLETAEMAIQAALTGHLVFSTLHTNDAASAVTRLLDIGIAPYLIKATVLGVLGQRLVRTLCPSCKARAEVDPELWDSLTAPWKSRRPQHIHQPVGCLECRQTGFRGRVGIYEMLPLGHELKQQIVEGADFGDLRRAAVRAGMKPLRLDGARKVAAGLTTLEEVFKVAPPEHETSDASG